MNNKYTVIQSVNYLVNISLITLKVQHKYRDW